MEHYERVVREDMLTLFNRTASFKMLECSMVLHGASMLSSETKYRAACILEIVTGQRVLGETCEVGQEDPLRRRISDEQQRELDRIRGVALRQSIMASQKKGQQTKKGSPQPGQLTTDDLRKLGNGFKLKTVLQNVRLFDFLEKCREFYLPDVIGKQEKTAKAEAGQVVFPECGHPNDLRHAHMIGHFERFTPSGLHRRALGPAENPTEAISTYLLRSSDLLKFPDIELHFESMGSLVTREGSDDSSTLHLILRPCLRVDRPNIDGLQAIEEAAGQQIDNAKVMNYLLSQYFNMYMRRPRVSGPY